jgi:hypothetical protein
VPRAETLDEAVARLRRERAAPPGPSAAEIQREGDARDAAAAKAAQEEIARAIDQYGHWFPGDPPPAPTVRAPRWRPKSWRW